MGKSREEKIQEEIRKRILEKDEAIQQRKDPLFSRDANRQALADITSFSREEVDGMADVIRREMEKRDAFRRNCIIAFFLILVVGGLIYLSTVFFKPEKLVFEETFDDNTNGWDTSQIFEYKRFLEDGKGYLFHVNKDGWCYWDDVDIEFPKNYIVELSTTWLSGEYDEYGLLLKKDKGNHYVFSIRGDGKARFSEKKENEWVGDGTWRDSPAIEGDGSATNIQRIEVADGMCNYFINDVRFTGGPVNDFPIKSVALRTCGEQKVAFSRLMVTGLNEYLNPSGVIFEDTFLNVDKGWIPKSDIQKEAAFEDGYLVFRSNKDEWCYWSNIDIPFQSKNFDVVLESVWKKGEVADYGLVLLDEDNNYFAFDLKKNGKAKYALYRNGEYEKMSSYRKGGNPGDGEVKNTQRIEIRGEKFKYYVNGDFVNSWGLQGLSPQGVGLRVCGKQTVAFDYLKMETK